MCVSYGCCYTVLNRSPGKWNFIYTPHELPPLPFDVPVPCSPAGGSPKRGCDARPPCSPSVGGWRACSCLRKLRSQVGRGPWSGRISRGGPPRPAPGTTAQASTLSPASDGGFASRTHLAPFLCSCGIPGHRVVKKTEPGSKFVCHHARSAGGRRRLGDQSDNVWRGLTLEPARRACSNELTLCEVTQ